MNDVLICLGSASPRRAELLSQLGVPFSVRAVDVDESVQVGELPATYVERLSLEKARAVVKLLDQSVAKFVLAADTAVVVDGEILGKPQDRAHGLAMMAMLSGRSHQVYTGLALVAVYEQSRSATKISISEVQFRTISKRERELYWATGEPVDKAGGYGIQGYAASFIRHLSGSFSGVMGLPIFETAELMREFGIDVCDNWRCSH